jgi:acetyltransferase
VGRLIKNPLQSKAEIAAVVSDSFHRKGIGGALVRVLIEFAKDERIEVLTASVLVESTAMQKLLEKQGFVFQDSQDFEVLEGQMRLF